jgi:hypothetical protein
MPLTLEDRMTFWTRLFVQSGTKAKEASAEMVTWPTLLVPEPKEMVVTALVARSIVLKLPALFSPMRANTGRVSCLLTATIPLEDMYPLAYPVGAVPNMVVSQLV